MNLNTENGITLYWKSIDQKRNRYNSRFEKAVYKALLNQLKPSLEYVSRQSSSLNPDDVAAQVSSSDIEKVLSELYSTVSIEFAKDSYKSLFPEKSYTVTVSTKNLDDLVTIWLDKFRQYVFTDGAEKVRNITTTTKTIIKRIIQKSGNEGLSIPDTSKLLLSEWRSLAKSRSVVIARTEIIAASNYGSLTGAQSTGLEIDKIWISTRDSRTRDKHIIADGQRVDINSNFQVGGESLPYPGGGKIPSNNIQCRCTVGYKRKGED
ncbi:phage minor head protein [Catalinimonas sp. 4WD22]|uniref:phage minor head protein n=1 Tax=Catalinimonas locisalis TaxID=3133978 RepID=UPI0031017EDF